MREDFGLRWQSAAATPLAIADTFQSGVALRFPPQSKKFWLRPRCGHRVSAVEVRPEPELWKRVAGLAGWRYRILTLTRLPFTVCRRLLWSRCGGMGAPVNRKKD